MEEPPAYESGPSGPAVDGITSTSAPPIYAPSTIAIPLPEPFRMPSVPWQSLPESLPVCESKVQVPLAFFAVVTAYLDQRSISRLARTCKPLYDLISPALFYEPEITNVNFDKFLQSIANSHKPGWYVSKIDLTNVVGFLSMATSEFYGMAGSNKELWTVMENKAEDYQTPQMVWLAVLLKCCPSLQTLVFRTGGEPLWRTESLRLALNPAIRIKPPVIKTKNKRSMSSGKKKIQPPLDQQRPPPRITNLVLRGSSTVNCMPNVMLQFLRRYCPIYIRSEDGQLTKLRYDFGMARSLLDKDLLKAWLSPPSKVKEKKVDPNAVPAASGSQSKAKGKGLFGGMMAIRKLKNTKAASSPPVSPTSTVPAKVQEFGAEEGPEEPYAELDLDLSHMPGHAVDDSLMMVLARMPVNFSHLSLAYSTSFSEFSLGTLVASVPQLMHLTIAGCLQITQAVLPSIFASTIQILDMQYSGIKATSAKFDSAEVREISLHYQGDSEGYVEEHGVHQMKCSIAQGLQLAPELMGRLPRLSRLNICLNSPDEWQLRPTTDWSVLVPPAGKDASAFSPTQVTARTSSRVLKNYVKPERAWAIPTPTMVTELVKPLRKPCLIALAFMEEGKKTVHVVRKLYIPHGQPESSEELPLDQETWVNAPLLGDLDISRLNADLESSFGKDVVRIALAIDYQV